MSAVASAILVESPVYRQAPLATQSSTEAIRELLHELRQPLSSIEAIAYFVEMTLPPDQLQARQQMRRLQDLVFRAEAILEGAASTTRAPAASTANVA